MALAAREAHIATGDDHAIAVERNIVVDPESGVAAKVENVAVAVDLGDGNVGVAHHQKVVGIGLAPGAEVIIVLLELQAHEIRYMACMDSHKFQCKDYAFGRFCNQL